MAERAYTVYRSPSARRFSWRIAALTAMVVLGGLAGAAAFLARSQADHLPPGVAIDGVQVAPSSVVLCTCPPLAAKMVWASEGSIAITPGVGGVGKAVQVRPASSLRKRPAVPQANVVPRVVCASRLTEPTRVGTQD